MEQKLQTFQWPAGVFACTVMPVMAAVERAIFSRGNSILFCIHNTMYFCTASGFLTPSPHLSLFRTLCCCHSHHHHPPTYYSRVLQHCCTLAKVINKIIILKVRAWIWREHTHRGAHNKIHNLHTSICRVIILEITKVLWHAQSGFTNDKWVPGYSKLQVLQQLTTISTTQRAARNKHLVQLVFKINVCCNDIVLP